MTLKDNRRIAVLAIASIAALLLAACGGGPPPTPAPPPTQTVEEPTTEEHMEDHMEEEHDEHMHGEEHDEHMDDMHGVPDDAAAVENPIDPSDESIAMGAEAFATNCAVCHGDTGLGDGDAAAGLAPPPANLHEDHVQVNTDGALFYIISNGVEGTAMVGFEDVLTEDERWHVVNFLRTFGEG